MPDSRLPAPRQDDAEVRLELTNGEGRQVWALYSRPPQEAGPAETPLSVFLHELPPLAWKWRRYVALTVVGAVALGAIYLMLATSIFGVSALILVEHRDTGIQGYAVMRDDSSFLATQAEILHSPPVVRGALVSSGIGFPDEEPGLFDRVVGWLPFVSAAESVDGEKVAVAGALESLEATPVLGTQVIAMNYRTEDAASGLRFVQSVIDSYRDYIHDLDQSGQTEVLALIEGEEKQRREVLRELELQYAELRASGGTIGDGNGVMAVEMTRLEEHARHLVEAQSERIRVENELRAARSVSGAPAESSDALRAAEQRLAELRQSYSDRHPEVRAVLAQVEALRSPLPQTSANQVQDLQRRLRAARDTEANLSALYEATFRKSKQVDVQRMNEERLGEEVTNAREAHQAALKLLQDKRLTVQALSKDGAGVVVRTLEAPTLLDEALWPRPVPVLFCCIVIGVLAGLGLAVVVDRAQEPEPQVYSAASVREGVRAG